MSFLYFAYGSNMLPARLLARCPSARPLGLAHAEGHDLAFSKMSKDGSGKATLVPATERTTPGILFEIALTERSALDRAEGAGQGYARIDDFTILIDNAERSTNVVTTYLATAHVDGLQPYDWYLALVIAGAVHHGFGASDVERLQQVAHVIDPDPDRRTRCEALSALSASGIADYRALWPDRSAMPDR